MSAQVVITPRSKNQIIQDMVGGAFCSSLVTGFLCLYTNSLLLASGLGCGAGLAGFLFARWRFNSYSPIQISADDNAVNVVPRSGPPVGVQWGEIRKAAHSTLLGGKWTIYFGNRKITIYDDGIDSSDWSEFSRILNDNLVKICVPVIVDPIHNITS